MLSALLGILEAVLSLWKVTPIPKAKCCIEVWTIPGSCHWTRVRSGPFSKASRLRILGQLTDVMAYSRYQILTALDIALYYTAGNCPHRTDRGAILASPYMPILCWITFIDIWWPGTESHRKLLWALAARNNCVQCKKQTQCENEILYCVTWLLSKHGVWATDQRRFPVQHKSWHWAKETTHSARAHRPCSGQCFMQK